MDILVVDWLFQRHLGREMTSWRDRHRYMLRFIPFIQPMSTIGVLHVCVNFSRIKYAHASPTDVRLARRTRHMVAPLGFLDENLARRASLCTVILRPLLNAYIVLPPPDPELLARYLILIMGLLTAARANHDETWRALEIDSVLNVKAKDLDAIWSGTVLELLRMLGYIRIKYGVKKLVKLMWREESLDERNSNWNFALRFVSHAY
jgi:hypothetical protein